MLSQEDYICVYEGDDPGLGDPGGGSPAEPHNSGSIDPADLAAFEPKLFNMYYWQINDANGNYGENEVDGDFVFEQTEIDALKSIAKLNQIFNEYNIFFKYRGADQMDSPSTLVSFPAPACSETALNNFNDHGFSVLDLCLSGELHSYALDSGNYDDGAINVYIPSRTTSFGGQRLNSEDIVINRATLNEGSFVHEVGHILGLSHTFSNYYSKITQGGVVTTATECEHVSRIMSDTSFNAIPIDALNKGNGDKILDTNAVPNFIREYCWNNGINPAISWQECTDTINNNNLQYYNIDNCDYIGFGEDCEDTPYQIDPADVQNYMAYTENTCRNQFTTGQAIHMHEDIEEFSNDYNRIRALDFSSLYEPYKGNYYFAGPYDNETNTVLFQPGFDYKFIRCEGNYNEPAPYGENFSFYTTDVIHEVDAYEFDFTEYYHPNHTAVVIEQIDDAFGFARVEKCYNNTNRMASGGRVVRFNDGVINYNTTTTEKSGTEINDPTTINTLDPGLYKIEKDYQNAPTTQTVILKENE
ncbi:MAG: hypothetical protein ACSHW7_03385 [Patiriisocius sp.]|uniref:hypothetical protein n=1 Tax=Patiriisocius sp. TaxID=2822396 RepID=UPI003EF40F02